MVFIDINQPTGPPQQKWLGSEQALSAASHVQLGRAPEEVDVVGISLDRGSLAP